MTSEQPPSGAASAPDGKPRRRPPTIELTATEIDAARAAAGESAPDGSAGRPGRGAMDWLPARIPWPMIGAGAAGGAVVAIVLGIATLLVGRWSGEGPLATRLALVERQLRELWARPLPAGGDAARLEDLSARLAKLEAAAAAPRPSAPAAVDPALANRISTLEGSLKAMGETVAILGRRGDETAVAARERAAATAAALAELSEKVSRPAAPALGRGEFEALADCVAAVERAEKSVEAALAKRAVAEGSDRAVRLALAAAALKVAVERGDPFAAELAAAKALAAEGKLLAPLEAFAASGVPTAAALGRELAALVPALAAAAGAPPRDGGFLDRLAANAEKLVRIRPLDEVADGRPQPAGAGGDAAAIVARVEVRAGRGDLAGALAELARLPANARAPAAPWIGKAEARAAAIEASRRLAADALAGVSR